MNYLDGLNDRQKEAVLAIDGPVSVLAGAGSGKTRVLTTRIYHLIRQGVPVETILAVTFTNKAAREMRERLRARLGEDSPMPTIATFHGLGRILLEEYGRVIDVPRYFSIFDRSDSERVVKEALKAMDIDPKEVPPRAILSRISKAKGEGLTSVAFREKHSRESFRSRVASEVWQRYDKALHDEKALDFDDLISLPVRLLNEHSEVRNAVQQRFHYVHIDEFQDTSELQGNLAEILTEKHHNLFVVGDIDQCIYTWRGATIDNLLSFEQKYPNAKTIVLETNYRSSGTIVSTANSIIEQNKNRKEKRSITENPAGEHITIHIAPNAESEAVWIAKEIKSEMRNGLSPENIAILFRTNFQSRALEEGLLHSGVPYKLLGTRFFDRKEVKDVLSWVRLAMEPSRENDRMRAVQAPPRGIGKVTLGKIASGQKDTLGASARVKVDEFDSIVNELSEMTLNTAPSVFLQLVLEKSGLETVLANGTEEERERLENIRELATLASRYDATPGKDGISAFLADASLASDQDELDRKNGTSGVTLMTVHAAKGLEFDTVFVTGMEEGLFPHEGMGGGENRDEEEERRLFYVAVTRAKRRLILTLAYVRRIYGTDYQQDPSSFISDIDEKYIDYVDTGKMPTVFL
ncbi:MAG TPA: ATP-dependent DNA helicase PcrA [Candidatus Kaiserbacteria bacterium]|nr:ATP-dependent DNA helicase PcrA [Candidatus Kaiserbacteria bacterium]